MGRPTMTVEAITRQVKKDGRYRIGEVIPSQSTLVARASVKLTQFFHIRIQESLRPV